MLACPLACHEREFDSDMTTQPNAQPASQPASKPASAAAPSLNWQYPFPRNNQKSIANPQDLYSILGLMDDGFFPLGVNGFPHGGIHFGAAVSKDLDLSGGVRCIADGEIVAYKVDGGYPQLRFTQSGTWSMYSTGFVLVRHRLMMPPAPNSTGPQPADDCHDVYSLYMHLADWSTYLGDGKLDRPSWWLGVDAYRVGNKARQDAAKKGGSLGASGSFVWTEPKPGKKANQFTRGQHVGFLPEGSELTIGEKRGKPGKQWGHIAAITAGGMISPTDGGIFGEEDNPVPWKHDDDATPNAPVMPEGDWGWVYMPELQPVREPKPTGSVVIPPAPIQVRAGTLMGQLGEYHDYERSTPLPPVAKRQLLHMEVFADDGFTAFLAKCRERAAQLPKEQRTTLVLNKGAKLVSQLTPPDVTLRPAREWAPTQNCPTTGRWAYTYTAIRQPVSKVRTEVDGPMWMERADTKQPPVVGGKGWRNFPLQLAAADAQVGFSCAYPRARLEALPADCQAVDTEGNRWWKVEFGSETGHTASGWVREQGHPGTQWQSPWAWPDFEIVDATGINLADAFRRNIVISGTADYKEHKEFEPSLVAVNNNPLLFKLGQIVSKLPDRSGYTGKLDKKGGKPTVTAAKMQEAMRTAWLSDELAHIILRYESEWGGNMSRWDAITPLMRNARENWQCEVQRIKKLQWWDDVKKVAGFPANPIVLHIHPAALIANFSANSRHPFITIQGLRRELQFLLKSSEQAINEKDYADAAAALGCEVLAIKAVAKTETGSSGPYFRAGQDLASGDDPVPTILFERHLFHRATQGKYDQSHSRISNPQRGGYGRKSVQYDKLVEAYELDQDSALLSASWGRFQILGSNFKSAGFKNVRDYVASISESESNQLRAFVSFIKADSVLRKAIIDKDWHGFAVRYNGPAQQGYDAIIAQNYYALGGK